MNLTLKNIIFYHNSIQSNTFRVAHTFRYKSIETGKTDYVKVDFSNYNGLKDSVIFKDRFGIKLKLSKDNILHLLAHKNLILTIFMRMIIQDKELEKLDSVQKVLENIQI